MTWKITASDSATAAGLWRYNSRVKQITFTIHSAEEGGFWAEADGVSISTQGETLDELAAMIEDAVQGYFFDAPEELPETITWRFDSKLRVA
jgi:predicted RNase H-like HicB family nuclease